ncbi:unnamed protein product [Heterobilharzia americana]|nr:unnamed protein product [Heterobilharzia americana]
MIFSFVMLIITNQLDHMNEELYVKGFLVKASSSTVLGEIHSTTKLEAHITFSLETVSQSKIETIMINGKVMEKTFSIKLVDNVYEISTTESVNGEMKSSTKKQLLKSTMFGFITEGADIIFQRMVVKLSSIPLEVIGLDPDYNLATVSYVSLGERNIFVGDSEVAVKGIQRTVHSKSSLPSSWQTYFMDDGHLILRMQVGSPITIKVDKIPERFKIGLFLCLFPLYFTEILFLI